MKVRRSPAVLAPPAPADHTTGHRRTIKLSDLVSNAIATATTLTTVAGLSISLAVLIFSGEASAELPRAAGAFAVAAGVTSIWLALRSQVLPVATSIQDGPGMVVAVLAANYVAEEQTRIVDIFVLLGLTTALSGMALWLLGHFGLGSLVRCMPTTVIGGFIAGTGWLLFKGGFDVMAATTLGLNDFGRLFAPELGRFWLPGFALGLLVWGISTQDRLPAWAVGVTTLLAAVGFYVVSAQTSSIAAIEEAGWLIGPFPESSGAAIVSVGELTGANWSGLLATLPGIVGVAGLTAVAMLLNAAGINSQRGSRVDLNHELRATGVANIIASPLGATPGFHSLGGTALLDKLDVRTRAVPLAIGCVFVLLGVGGVQVIGYVPRMIPGGLLIFLGASILQQWGKMMQQSSNTVERVLSVAIVLVIAWMGILPGMAAGLLATCAVFVLRYSKVDPVRVHGSGASHQSLAERTAAEQAVLDEHADRLAVFQLQGYLFFGSLALLERQIRSQALGRDPNTAAVDAVVLDFGQVTGIEASATGMVHELQTELEAKGVMVILSSLPHRVRRSMESDVAGLGDGAFVSLDAALEFYENCRLPAIDLRAPTIDLPLARKTLSAPLYERFEIVHIEPGHVLSRQASPSAGVFIVESGSLTAYRLSSDLVWQRLRQIAALGVVGDIGLISGFTHPATVVADTRITGLWMSNTAYRMLRRDSAELTGELHEFLLRRQTERVIVMSKALAHTQR